MLAIMSYSIELIFSAILGLAFGFLIFSQQPRNIHNLIVSNNRSGNPNNAESVLDGFDIDSNNATGTPCCGFDGGTKNDYVIAVPNDEDGTEPTSLLLRRTNNSMDL